MIALFPFQQVAVDAVFRDWAAGQRAWSPDRPGRATRSSRRHWPTVVCPPLVVTGLREAPVVGVLPRYQRSVAAARAETFAAFVRDTLPRCHFAVSAGQWRAIGTALTAALSVLGPISVVMVPPTQADGTRPRPIHVTESARDLCQEGGR